VGIHRWSDRVRKVLIWGIGSGLLALGLLAALLLFTPLADDIGKAWLTRTLAKQGISLRVGETKGTLARGLEVRDLRVEKPGEWSLTASRLRLELSLWSVLWGRPQLKEVVLEDAQAVLTVVPRSGGEPEREGSLPNLGISRWVLRRASVRLLREGDPLPWVGDWSRLDGEGGLTMGGRSLRVSMRSLEAVSADSRLSPLQASGTVSWASGSGVTLDLSATSAGSNLSVRGRLSGKGEGTAWKGQVDARDFDLSLLRPLWPAAPERRATGAFSVEASRERASWKGTVAVPGSGRAEGTGAYVRGNGGGTVQGEARVEGFALGTPPLLAGLQALAPAGSGRVGYRVLLPAGGPPALRLELDVGPAELYGVALTGCRGTVDWSGGAVQVQAHGASTLAESVDAAVERTPEGHWQVRAQGDGVRLEPLLRALRLWRDPPAPLRLPAVPWRSVQFALEVREGGGLSLDATGTCEALERAHLKLQTPPGGGEAGWEVQAQSLAPRPFGLDYEGSLSGTLVYRPSGGGLGSYRAAVGRSRFAGLDFEPFDATVWHEARGYRMDPVRLATSDGSGTLALEWDEEGRREGTLSVDLPDARKAAALAGGQAPTGPLRGQVRFRGEGERWTLDGSLRMATARWAALSGRGVGIEGRWELPSGGGDIALNWQDLTVGSQPMGAGALTLRGPAERIRAELRAALGPGRELAVAAEGTLGSQAVDLSLSGGRLRLLGGEVAQVGVARLTSGPEGTALAGLSLKGDVGSATLDLKVGGGEADGPLRTSGALKVDHLSLAAFPFPPTAGAVSGRVSADLRWSGTLAAPGLEGMVRLEEGAYRFARSDLAWTPVTLEFAARGDRLELVRGSASSPEGGEASATGWVTLKDLLPAAFRLEAVGKAMPFVIGRDVEAAADFSVTLSGTLAAPEIAGRALVVKGRILLPDISRQAPLPQTVTFRNAPAGSVFAPPPEQEAPVVGRLRGSVELQSTGGLWVSNRNLLGELTGTVRAEFTDAGVVLRGGLQLGQGRYRFQGKTFEITTARILFNAEGEVLDVTALYTASDATEVTVRLFGPPGRPQIQLSSRPPLDSSGILAVLLYDHRPEELSAQERTDWAAAAASLALQYQAGDMLDSVGRHMGLDAITVVTGDTGQSAGVGLTKSVGDRVVVEYQQLFGTLPEERVNLRYRINRRLSFRGRSSSLDGTTADLLWEKRY